MVVNQDKRLSSETGEPTASDSSAVPESETLVDTRPPFEDAQDDISTLQANQYLGRGVARLFSGAPGVPTSELTPSSEDCLTPGLMTPGCDTGDEHDPQLGVPPTSLPDVKRALDALRAGKSVKPPGTQPYGKGAGGSESKRATSECGTPSAVSVSSGRSSAPAPGAVSVAAAARESKRAPTRAKVWARRVVMGALAAGGWVAAWALAYVHMSKSNQASVPPASVQSAASDRAATPAPSASRARTDPTADATMLEKLAELPAAELTPDQWVLLAKERARKRSEELKELATRTGGNASDPLSADAMARLSAAASDPRTAPEALYAMSSLGGTVGADLIYQVASDEHLSAETRRLALDLLATKAVQDHVSEPLRVVLDLTQVKTCEAAEQVLGRVLEVGDRRALAPLRALFNTRGCGPQKADDCYPCLRKGRLLNRSVEAVRKRRSPLG
jgi:hypothetical protein